MDKKHAEAIIKGLTDKEKRRDWLQFLHYIPQGYDQNIEDIAHDFCFKKGFNVLLVTDRQRRNEAVCVACGHMVELPKGVKHKDDCKCPVCGCAGEVVHAWRRQGMERRGYFLYFQKADYDKTLVTCRGIYFNMYLAVGQGDPVPCYAFEDHSYMLFTPNGVDHRSVHDYIGYSISYNKHKSAFTRFSNYWNAGGYFMSRGVPDMNLGIALGSLFDSIKGTCLEHCQADYMIELDGDIIKYLEFYLKHPKTELIIKNGLSRLIVDKMVEKKKVAVNWRAKTMTGFLRLPHLGRKEKQYLKGLAGYIGGNWLSVMQDYVTGHPERSITDLPSNPSLVNEFEIRDNLLERLRAINGYGITTPKVFKYLGNCIKSSRRLNMSDALIYWSDYLASAVELELDLRDTAIMYPNNLKRAHDNLVSQLKLRANELLDKKIAETLENREKLSYQSVKYFCRPAKDTEELVAEGSALHHCVGTYAEKYAAGKTNIVFVRAMEAPDDPLVTMEISPENEVIQVRADRNRTPEPEILAFVEEYKAEVLANLRKGRKAA